MVMEIWRLKDFRVTTLIF